MKTRFLALTLFAPFAAALAWPSDARACGGCVVAPEDNTIVNSHRMALSISPKQTVLWDQIRYNGDPESWGWLLPVKPGAVVELSTDAWFETLDAATTTSVFAPPISCNNGSGIGCGFAQADFAGAPTSDALGGGVTGRSSRNRWALRNRHAQHANSRSPRRLAHERRLQRPCGFGPRHRCLRRRRLRLHCAEALARKRRRRNETRARRPARSGPHLAPSNGRRRHGRKCRNHALHHRRRTLGSQ
ncbi:MAG: DUF2330 domain-containing protein [Polyangiaceae bacterium]|nr:DUF2330 domain-containing protein [Polyangiaceae bacterium]